MESTLAIARREFRTFFSSPIAYIVLGGFLLLAGWLYFSTLFLAGQASLRGFFGVGITSSNDHGCFSVTL